VHGKTKYYLAHSFRSDSRVRKLRVFLGTDLGYEEVQRRAAAARAKLEDRIRSAKEIGDPYRTVLSPDELKEITLLTTRVEMKLAHLSETDWARFTEEFTYDTNAIEGSKVSKKEVRQVLTEGRWPEKSKEEISETIGVAEAVRYVRKTRTHLSFALILELHRIIFKNSKQFAGQTRRRSGVEVSVGRRWPSDSQRGTGEPGRFPAQKARPLVRGQPKEVPSPRPGGGRARPVRDDSSLPGWQREGRQAAANQYPAQARTTSPEHRTEEQEGVLRLSQRVSDEGEPSPNTRLDAERISAAQDGPQEVTTSSRTVVTHGISATYDVAIGPPSDLSKTDENGVFRGL